MLISGKHSATISRVMQGASLHVLEWCCREGLSINPRKIVPVPFTRKRLVNLGPIIIKGTTLAYSSEVKYLGVILDKWLSWNSHIKFAIERATKAMWFYTAELGV